jgi:hypothetical protein
MVMHFHLALNSLLKQLIFPEKEGHSDKSFSNPPCVSMGVWQGVATDSLKFYLGPPCPTLLQPAGRPPPKRPYNCFGSGPPVEQAACGCLLPFWTHHAVRLFMSAPVTPQRQRRTRLCHGGSGRPRPILVRYL